MDSRPVAPKPFAIFPGLGTEFASPFPAGSDRFLLHHVSRLNATVEMGAHWEAVVRALRTDDPSATLLASRLFSTGSETAREMAVVAVHDILTDIAYALEQSEDDPKWRGLAAGSWSPLNKNDMLLAWAAGAAMDELGEPMPGDHWDALRRFQRTDRRVSGYSDRDRSLGQWRRYWRGLAALHLTGATENWDDEAVTAEQRREASAFIDWAGLQSDASAVVGAVRERGTLNPDTLAAVVAEKGAVLAAFGDGVL